MSDDRFDGTYGPHNPRPVCILDADSPSYPPDEQEYRQCSCRACLNRLCSDVPPRASAAMSPERQPEPLGEPFVPTRPTHLYE